MNSRLFAFILLAALAAIPASAAGAEGQGVVVTVNDLPITDFDIEQRMKLWSAIGRDLKTSNARKEALQSLIDDMIKQAEAKKFKTEVTDEVVDKQIERMASSSGGDAAGLAAKLKNKGVSMAALRQLVKAQLSFNRILNALYKVKVEVDPAEVDKKLQQIESDPRLKPVTVYEILEITFPVEKTSDAMMQQLLMARAAEAQLFRRNYKGCSSARKAASGIFNVHISQILKADGSKLGKPLKAALDQVGPGGLLGPARARDGVQLIGFCKKANLAPPKPSREQIEALLMNKKYDTYEDRYMRELRRNAFIDYKDATYAQ